MSTIPYFRVVVPVRWDSSRLPGKPLADLHGRPMVQRVWERARASGAAEVIVATDDARVLEACRQFGADAELTDPQHASGTDRVAEVVRRRGWPADAIVVNVQGDEPMIPPQNIVQTAELFEVAEDVAVTTLYAFSSDLSDGHNPHVVKLVCAQDGRALYFSRAPIPWERDASPAAEASSAAHLPQKGANDDSRGAHLLQRSPPAQPVPPEDIRTATGFVAAEPSVPSGGTALRRHIGLYGYRVHSLLTLARTPPCELEQLEKLEQLRALWLGLRIQTACARQAAPHGVDTPEDLARMRALLERME